MFLGLPNVISSHIRVLGLLEVRFYNIERSVNKSESYSLDLMVGMVMCRRKPGPLAFLMNVEKLGVAWGRGYQSAWLSSYEYLLGIASTSTYRSAPTPFRLP